MAELVTVPGIADAVMRYGRLLSPNVCASLRLKSYKVLLQYKSAEAKLGWVRL
ncbi:MAG: hypothetical protein AAGB11_04160 [Pseudomonadota bacterium]